MKFTTTTEPQNSRTPSPQAACCLSWCQSSLQWYIVDLAYHEHMHAPMWGIYSTHTYS